MKPAAYRLACACVALGSCLVFSGCGQRGSPRLALEHRFLREGKMLLMAPYRTEFGRTARGIHFDRAVLATHELYLRNPRHAREYVHVDSQGLVTHTGKLLWTIESGGELLLTPTRWLVYADGVPLDINACGWDVYWVAGTEASPAVRIVDHSLVELADGFMREELQDEHCQVSGGDWSLRQHGGGMPTTLTELTNAFFQRAVNPFSVCGSGAGALTFGSPDWINYHAEARFYFGVPRAAVVTDGHTLPDGTDMMLAQGDPQGNQVAFGWQGESRSFALLSRRHGGAWTLMEQWREKRPPLTTWFNLGLEVEAGHRVTALLDGVPVLKADLGMRVAGPLQVLCGRDPIEMDDVRAWSLPKPPDKGAPVYVTSRSFATKSEWHDPPQFAQWAASSSAFTLSRTTAPGGTNWAVMATAVPLLGDFLYESVPFDATVGLLPQGLYEFSLRAAEFDRQPGAATQEVAEICWRAARMEDVWQVYDLPEAVWPSGHGEFTLRFGRRAEAGQRLGVEVNGEWRLFSPPWPGPMRLSIARVSAPPALQAEFPRPEHHAVYAANLVNEFFEEAPSGWSWIDGAFRMDIRWACANRWNFMACGSTASPYMVSKRTFLGRQFHEYYLSLRPVTPWDAGDPNFAYDASVDTNWEVFRAHDGWYSRRDLNFSFCHDGRNPLSGYSVLFGADDNTETRLLRAGQVVARTREARFLFPVEPAHTVIHWSWWKFTVWRDGGHLRVHLNDDLLFDYTDPQPIDGGHIGFWSIRNGFALARAVSTAEEVGSDPQVMYVNDGDSGDWHPLLRDSVRTVQEADTGMTRVTAHVGGGFMAVRYRTPAAVDLRQAPVLELPLRLETNVAVNLHLWLADRSYLVAVGAPVADMKSLLTPEFEKGECFRIPTLSDERVKRCLLPATMDAAAGLLRVNLAEGLRALGAEPREPVLLTLTVGNTSNQDYLLAGNAGKNRAGASYFVGTPRFTSHTNALGVAGSLTNAPAGGFAGQGGTP